MDSIYEYLKSMNQDEIRILFRKTAHDVAYRFLSVHPELLRRSDHVSI